MKRILRPALVLALFLSTALPFFAQMVLSVGPQACCLWGSATARVGPHLSMVGDVNCAPLLSVDYEDDDDPEIIDPADADALTGTVFIPDARLRFSSPSGNAATAVSLPRPPKQSRQPIS